VFEAMLTAARFRWGSSDLSGKTVGILGVGKVGGRLAQLAAEAGALVVLADTRTQRAEIVAAALPHARSVDPAELLGLPLDILSPCAAGGIISSSVVPNLSVEIICGAANNTLACDSVAEALAARGILYVPDFLANAGGVVRVGGNFLGWDEATVGDHLDACVRRVADVLDEAERRLQTPLAIGLERANRRLTDAATGAALH
jgi:leucine dehydrogenase